MPTNRGAKMSGGRKSVGADAIPLLRADHAAVQEIHQHVREEQDELFPKVKKSGIDLKELGAQLERRKAELNGEKPTLRVSRRGNGRSARIQP